MAELRVDQEGNHLSDDNPLKPLHLGTYCDRKVIGGDGGGDFAWGYINKWGRKGSSQDSAQKLFSSRVKAATALHCNTLWDKLAKSSI